MQIGNMMQAPQMGGMMAQAPQLGGMTMNAPNTMATQGNMGAPAPQLGGMTTTAQRPQGQSMGAALSQPQSSVGNPYQGAGYNAPAPTYSPTFQKPPQFTGQQVIPTSNPVSQTGSPNNWNGSGYSNYNSSPVTSAPPISQTGQGMNQFQQYADQSYDQQMSRINPQLEAQDRAFDQKMIAQGISPGTDAYDKASNNKAFAQNDALMGARNNATQLGLAMQNQFTGQDIQREGLANQFGIAGMNNDTSRYNTDVGANASMHNAQLGANASMQNAQTGANASMANARYGADASMHNAGLANQLGWGNLNEQGRQTDMQNGLNWGQLNSQNMMGIGQLLLGNRGQDLQDWQAQQAANQNWFNNTGALSANAPGVQFTPTGDYVGNMQNAGQNLANAQNQQNQQMGQLLGMFGMSDIRLKKNIVKVDNVDNINIYEFDYIDKSMGYDRYRGVMAQEVMHLIPKAIKWINGFMAVDYSQLPVDMEVVK